MLSGDYSQRGKAMWVAGGGALTHAAVQLPAAWLSRLRHAASAVHQPPRRMEVRIEITCERAEECAGELAHSYAQSHTPAPRAFSGHKWPRSVYLDAAADRGPPKPPAGSPHLIRPAHGWDPEYLQPEHMAALRYEYELAGEPLDGVVTLRVLPNMVQHWQAQQAGSDDAHVRFTFCGDWGWGGSCVRVRASVWERVALPDTFQPALDARHRCEVDGTLICHLSSRHREGGSHGRHFEDVPLDEYNVARAERLAIAYQHSVAVGLHGDHAAQTARARRAAQMEQEHTRQRIELTALSSPIAMSSPTGGAPLSPRHVDPYVAASSPYASPSPQPPPIEVQIAQLEANVHLIRTGTHAEVEARRRAHDSLGPSGSPSPRRPPPSSKRPTRGVSDSPSLEVMSSPSGAAFNYELGGMHGATIMPDQSTEADYRSIRIHASPTTPRSPPSPPRTRTQQQAGLQRGRLMPLQVYTGDGNSGQTSPYPLPLPPSQLPPMSLQRRPLMSPAHSHTLRASPLTSPDPFRAHYAPDVSHFPQGSARPSPTYRAASHQPGLPTGTAAASPVRFFDNNTLTSPEATWAAPALSPSPHAMRHPISELTMSAQSTRHSALGYGHPAYVPSPNAKPSPQQQWKGEGQY